MPALITVLPGMMARVLTILNSPALYRGDDQIIAAQYIIIGSANINQRSMDGGRDTEIAVGGFQPYHVADPDLPRGDVRPVCFPCRDADSDPVSSNTAGAA